MKRTDSDNLANRIVQDRQRKLDQLADPANELSEDGIRRYSELYRRAWEHSSRAAATKILCLECMGYRRAEVARCASYACPLWEWRAFRTDEDGGDQ